jgi:hypothetical protein
MSRAYDRPMNGISATRLYGSSIAVISGLYSIISALSGAMRTPMMEPAAGLGLSGLIMLAVGVAVLVHGLLLLTPTSARIARVSGPLMVVWAVIMLGNQFLVLVMPGLAMGAMALDGGMIALAILMLISGLFMMRGQTRERM